jgi:hypothetical protein
MRIAHRKNVLFRDRAWWDTAVNLLSGCGGYAHSELIFDNGESWTSTTQFDPATLIYPSAPDMAALKRTNGPLLRQINFPGWEYDFTEVHLDDAQKLQVYRWCVETIDQSIKDQAGYDWNGIARFVLPWMKEHRADWFCSEAVVAALQTAGMFRGLKAWTISPNRLWKLCHFQ